MKEEQSLNDQRIPLQNFLLRLDKAPEPKAIGTTFDGNAVFVYISHVETTLDEFFFGLWDTVNFKWERIQNEIVASLELVVVNPVTGREVRRTGAAAVEIPMDAVPDEIKKDRTKRNQWALNLDNKKPGGMDLTFPKLKADCVKNAALSLGKLFGRDLNRKQETVDRFKPLVKVSESVPEELKEIISMSSDFDSLDLLWETNKELYSNVELVTLISEQKNRIIKGEFLNHEEGTETKQIEQKPEAPGELFS